MTLVEFFDYRCPYCNRWSRRWNRCCARTGSSLVYKEFPVLGPASVAAAQAALAAKKQDKYDAFHRAMMALPGQIDDAVFKVAASVGLDIARLKRDMKAPDIEAQLKENAMLGNVLDIGGTPAFIVGDTIVPGAISLDALKQLIATARKNKK